MRKIRIVLTGGGSGGHVYPLLAVASELEKMTIEKGSILEMVYLGPNDAFAGLIKVSGIKTKAIIAAKLRSYSQFENLLDVPKFFLSIVQALWKVFWIMPDVTFSKGGPGAFPVVFASWFYHVPVIIHDSDAIPGVTNILSAKFAKRIALSFDHALEYFDQKRSAVVGNPTRSWLLTDRPAKEFAKKELGFDPSRPLLAVLGGSQGAQRINEFIAKNLPSILKEVQVLHQTGESNLEEIEALARISLGAAYSDSLYKIVPYLSDDLKKALAATDVAVSRAGSGTLNEEAAFGIPAILIPLPESAHDHQRANARVFEKAGCGVIIEEQNLSSVVFLGELKKIISAENLPKMSSAAIAFFKPDAAKKIAEEILLLGR